MVMNSLEAVRSLVRSVIEEEDHPGESKKWANWPDDVEVTHEPTGSRVTIKTASRPTFSKREGSQTSKLPDCTRCRPNF
jgi:hypothetical protein